MGKPKPVPSGFDEKKGIKRFTRSFSFIAGFIAKLNPDIPYSLLAFYPKFYLDDFPTTSRSHALRCQAVAKDAGLNRVHVGNIHLLGDDY
jgi:pyruvate formate lyase activating enzyme